MKIQHITLLTLLLFSAASQADIAVVVHPDAQINRLDADEVKRIYLSKLRTFPGTQVKIVPIDQNSESEIYGRFVKTVIQKTESQLVSYWARKMFTGDGSMPVQSNDGSASVKALIVKNPNMIGYINKEDVDSSVKVVLTIQ